VLRQIGPISPTHSVKFGKFRSSTEKSLSKRAEGGKVLIPLAAVLWTILPFSILFLLTRPPFGTSISDRLGAIVFLAYLALSFPRRRLLGSVSRNEH
jgi:hypothetical protein